MVGDDVKSDTQGGLRAGLSGILVQTGKYTKGDEDVKGAPQALPPPPPHPLPLGRWAPADDTACRGAVAVLRRADRGGGY